MRKSVLLFACLGLLAVSLYAGAEEPCRYSAPRNAELDAAGLKSLSVEIGPDHLVIQGQPGLARIEVHGTACASDQNWLKDIKLEAGRQGDSARVVAHDGNRGTSFFHIFGMAGGSYAYLKLDVRVPPTLAVKLQEGSGDAQAGTLAALDASLGSGDLKVNGVTGEFVLSVGSGDAVASDVGSLHVASVGSGDASIDGVRSHARVGSVGSGDLHLRNVKGSVTLGSVSSGDAKLANVDGDVKVESVGSGDLDIRGVTGNIAVGSIASGGAEIRHAGGSVHAGSVGSGDFEADDVGGDFSVASVGSGDVSHRGVKGKVSVPRDDD